MKQLFDEYGYCIIPKGTPLFRTDKKPFFEGGIFFALESCVVQNKHIKNDSLFIQKWIAKQDIKVLFATTDVEGRDTKTLANIFNKYVAGSNKAFGDLCIKNQKDLKQVSFVKFLKQNGINGWFATIEGSCDFEVCLFLNESELLSWIELEGLYKEETLKGIHSLEYLELSPSDRFWQENNDKLTKDVLTFYRNNIKLYINEDKLPHHIAKARSYNLRVKITEDYLNSNSFF